MKRRKWNYIGVEDYSKDPIENIIKSRGVEDIEAFLSPSIDDLYDFSVIDDLDLVLDRIKLAIKNKEIIVLEHDYDADGIGGGSTGFLMLTELGARVFCRANNRFNEGYGLCIKGIDDMISKYGKDILIITIDNGITQHEAISYAKAIGIDVIVTDHHEPHRGLPDTEYIVNPKANNYPFKGLCGAGVIWKLLTELYPNKEKDTEKYLDIVALSTVADVVPLLEENRIIVTKGLELMNEKKRPFFKIISEITKVEKANSFTLGYIYGPILNAIGRLTGDVSSAVQAIVSEDEEEIREIVEKLVAVNDQRKEMSVSQTEMVKEKILEKEKLPFVIVYQDNRVNQGVAGIVAGRIKEEFFRPTIIFSEEIDGVIKASGRSIPNFDIMSGLKELEDIVLGYGGHDVAAGLSIKMEDLDEFGKRINEFAERVLVEDDLVPIYEYVHALKEEDITHKLIRDLDRLEPYGEGFPKPLFKLYNFNVKRHNLMGKDNIGLKLIGDKVSLLAWHQADIYKDRIKNMNNIIALGFPEINEWRDIEYLQFMIKEDNYY